MEISKRIRALLDDLFARGPLADCYVLDIAQGAKGSVTVYIDSDSGVTFEKCTQVSRYLEKHLDEEQFMGGEYTLDVSSPGAERPLMLWRQYPKHKGRRLLVTLKDGERLEGRLEEVGLEGIELQITKATSKHIPFSEIENSIVQISF